jgi:hypothetical protein
LRSDHPGRGGPETGRQRVASSVPAARKTAATRAKIFGTDLPDVKVSLDRLGLLEEEMRHFYLKAIIEKTAGELADWAAVDRAMMQAASLARDLAAWKHPKLSAVRGA